MRRFIVLFAVLTVVVVACSGGEERVADVAGDGGAFTVGGAGSGEASSGDDAAAAEAAGGSGAGGGAGDGSLLGDLELEPIGATGREIIQTGRVRTLVDDVPAAVVDAKLAAEARGGFVFGQSVSVEGDPFAQLTLKVPAPSFGLLMDDLAAIGEVQGQETTAEDVTGQVVDLESRVASARKSVERVRGFLDRANTVDELARVEGELTRREADLEALEARLAALEDQTSLSTITLSVATDDDGLQEAEEAGTTGFSSGLDAGGDAFLGLTRNVLAAVGFALPFVPVVGLLGAGLWLAGRHRRRSASVVGAEA